MEETNKLILQHNAITSGRYNFTACQLDIMFMLLAKTKQNKLTYNIHIDDIQQITGRKWNYKQLKENANNLGDKDFFVFENGKYDKVWLFQKVKYVKKQGCLNITISETAQRFFFDLKNNFTTMQLRSTLNISSKYAKRLYALACQWKSVGKKRFEILDLKMNLGLVDDEGNEQFMGATAFRKYVLDIAKKQINKDTDISFDYKLIKQGRLFKWIEIYVKDKPLEKQLTIDFTTPIEDQKYITKIKTYGLNQYQAEIIAQKEKELDFDNLIVDLNDKIKKGKIIVNNSESYIIGIYKKKGILN